MLGAYNKRCHIITFASFLFFLANWQNENHAAQPQDYLLSNICNPLSKFYINVLITLTDNVTCFFCLYLKIHLEKTNPVGIVSQSTFWNFNVNWKMVVFLSVCVLFCLQTPTYYTVCLSMYTQTVKRLAMCFTEYESLGWFRSHSLWKQPENLSSTPINSVSS